MMLPVARTTLTFALAVSLAGGALAGMSGSPLRQTILDQYAAEARRADPGFRGFSGEAGRAFFLAHPGSGSPATPSCTTCHTISPLNPGHTRAGKEIAPMAVSVTPTRFTDLAKVEKWFDRNCRTVYGRACTAVEKGNYISFMAGL
jgi:hypothetical protein